MKLSKEENNQQWKDLCAYIKKNILRYDDKKIFPKAMALRLKGLAQGKEYPNKTFTQIYTYDFIKKAFIFFNPMILEIVDRTTIKNEQHLVNLIMKVAQENFNDFVDRYNRTVKRQRDMEKKDMTQILNSAPVDYVRKSAKRVKDNW